MSSSDLEQKNWQAQGGQLASYDLLPSRSAPVLPLRLYCLSIVCLLGLPGSAPARMLGGHSSETFSVAPLPPRYGLDYRHSSVLLPGAPSYVFNRAIWPGTCTAALHLQACPTCSDLLSTICPCSPLVCSDMSSAPPPPSLLHLALGYHLQALWPPHRQSSPTLRKPQLQDELFLLLLTQKRSNNLLSQKEA